MTEQRHQVEIAVIGAGPGGYPAAIKAAQLGKKVALIEAGELGGTCLNRGCIPSKALIANAQLLHQLSHAEELGIHIDGYTVDFGKMVDRKDSVVGRVRKGLESLIRSNDIELIRGHATLLGPREIAIQGPDERLLRADKIILATGSEPRELPSLFCDQKRVLDSTAMLNIRQLPKTLVIIGGGVIGCEFASLYRPFGTRVIVVEMLPRLLPMECSSVSQALDRSFRDKGIEIFTNSFVERIDRFDEGIDVHISGQPPLRADLALVAVGRSLNTLRIGLDKAGVLVDDKSGLIQVNHHMQTNVENIYAIGDIASRWWLAHVASHQGLVAARHACGDTKARMHYNAVPSVIFTTPEIATVGLSLEQAIEQGYQATLGSFPFQALGKSQATLQVEGFAQVVTDRSTGQILGAQVVGHDAATLVAEMAIVIANELTIDCVTETIHAHPTVAEAWMEAVLVANETPLHLPPKRSASRSRPKNG